MHISKFIEEDKIRTSDERRSTIRACVSVAALILSLVVFAKNVGWL